MQTTNINLDPGANGELVGEYRQGGSSGGQGAP